MKIKINVNDEEKIVELFQVTYECAPERFKSLRISEGSYPTGLNLDFEDEIAIIKDDFLVDLKSDIQSLKDMMVNIETTNKDGQSTIKNNWFHFPAGTLILDVVNWIDDISGI